MSTASWRREAVLSLSRRVNQSMLNACMSVYTVCVCVYRLQCVYLLLLIYE